MVRFPDPRFYGDGPYPTVIELSGYDPSNPADPEPGSLIAQAFGYATVGVNLRGTGCSGGVFDVFSAAEQADGYDLIEIVARQPWVLHNHVGMVGLSLLGHHAALRRLDAAAEPGGVGVAVGDRGLLADVVAGRHLQRRLHQAVDRSSASASRPAGRAGRSTASTPATPSARRTRRCATRASASRPSCARWQFRPDDADDRDLSKLVPMIDRPVFLTGAWQDEQTGPRFATMLGNFTGPGKKRFVLFNGHHPDGYSRAQPEPLVRVPRPLRRQARAAPARRWCASRCRARWRSNFGVPLELDPDRFADLDDSPVRRGAGTLGERAVGDRRLRARHGRPRGRARRAGAALHRGTSTSSRPPTSQPWRLYLDADGTLVADAPAPDEGADRFTFDAAIGMVGYAPGGRLRLHQADASRSNFDWQPTRDGKGLSYLTEPLDEDVVIAGSGHADLWLRSESAEADLEIVLSEITPDGDEVRIQNGVLRAGFRTIDEARSDDFTIQMLYDADDYEPVPVGECDRRPGADLPGRAPAARRLAAARADQHARAATCRCGSSRTSIRAARTSATRSAAAARSRRRSCCRCCRPAPSRSRPSVRSAARCAASRAAPTSRWRTRPAETSGTSAAPGRATRRPGAARRRTGRRGAARPAVLATVVRLIGLDGHDFWFDEALEVARDRLPWPRILFHARGPDPPLFRVLMSPLATLDVERGRAAPALGRVLGRDDLARVALGRAARRRAPRAGDRSTARDRPGAGALRAGGEPVRARRLRRCRDAAGDAARPRPRRRPRLGCARRGVRRGRAVVLRARVPDRGGGPRAPAPRAPWAAIARSSSGWSP